MLKKKMLLEVYSILETAFLAISAFKSYKGEMIEAIYCMLLVIFLIMSKREYKEGR
jgi:hypothetical protein